MSENAPVTPDAGLEALLGALGPEHRETLRKLVRKIGHDLNNHVGSISIDVFTIEQSLERGWKNDGATARDLERIQQSLEAVNAAAERVAAYVATLSAVCKKSES